MRKNKIDTIFFILTFLVALAAGTNGQERNDKIIPKPEVWLCPSGDKVFALLSEEQKWEYPMNRLTGLKLYIDLFPKAKPEDLACLVKFVKAQKFRIIVECGGTLSPDWQDRAGEISAKIELEKLEFWYRAGGTIDYLDIDGPESRLLIPGAGWSQDPSKVFVSYERCARQLAVYMKAIRKTHPEIQFFLLTNFPNWGYKGGVSYHGRGPRKQDNGDYAEVIKTMLEIMQSEGLSFAGATVDNPYEYAIGSYKSATLDSSKINWISRIRDYEDYCRSMNLDFNLIINAEEGGAISDKEFFERTLKMLDVYDKAGGRPTRYFIQSWYEYPKTIIPDSAPFSITALTKAVLEKFEPRLTIPVKGSGK